MSSLQQWSDPFAGLTSLHSQLDDMFSNIFTGTPTAQGIPAMDVYTEDDKTLVAEVQAPGFRKEDIDVNVHNGALEIKGEKHEKEEDQDKKQKSYMVRESHASFYRSIVLPKTAEADKVEVRLAERGW